MDVNVPFYFRDRQGVDHIIFPSQISNVVEMLERSECGHDVPQFERVGICYVHGHGMHKVAVSVKEFAWMVGQVRVSETRQLVHFDFFDA